MLIYDESWKLNSPNSVPVLPPNYRDPTAPLHYTAAVNWGVQRPDCGVLALTMGREGWGMWSRVVGPGRDEGVGRGGACQDRKREGNSSWGKNLLRLCIWERRKTLTTIPPCSSVTTSLSHTSSSPTGKLGDTFTVYRGWGWAASSTAWTTSNFFFRWRRSV